MFKIIFSILSLLIVSVPFAANAVTFPSPIKTVSVNDFIQGVINIFLAVILPIAVITILVAAFFILTAQGDGEKISRGKKILIFGLAGLVIVILGAGSGVLLKNIFGTKEIAFETDLKAPSSLFGLEERIDMMCGVDTASLKKQLTKANENNDYNAIEELNKQVQAIEAGKYLTKLHDQMASSGVNIYDEQLGLYALENVSQKLDGGWYKLSSGKYNPSTKEYIDDNGKTYQNCPLLYDGSVLIQ